MLNIKLESTQYNRNTRQFQCHFLFMEGKETNLVYASHASFCLLMDVKQKATSVEVPPPPPNDTIFTLIHCTHQCAPLTCVYVCVYLSVCVCLCMSVCVCVCVMKASETSFASTNWIRNVPTRTCLPLFSVECDKTMTSPLWILLCVFLSWALSLSGHIWNAGGVFINNKTMITAANRIRGSRHAPPTCPPQWAELAGWFLY